MHWLELLLGFCVGATIFGNLWLYTLVTSSLTNWDDPYLNLTNDRLDNLWDYSRSINKSVEIGREQDDNLLKMIIETRRECGLDVGDADE